LNSHNAFLILSIPVICEDTGLLPSLVRRNHIDNYAAAVSLTRRLPESSMILGLYSVSLKVHACDILLLEGTCWQLPVDFCLPVAKNACYFVPPMAKS
jgi:hypothetical protein